MAEGFKEGAGLARDESLSMVESAGLDPAKPVRSFVSGMLNFGKAIMGSREDPGAITTGEPGSPIKIDPEKGRADPLLGPSYALMDEADAAEAAGDTANAKVKRFSAVVPIVGPVSNRIGDRIRGGMETGDYSEILNGTAEALAFLITLELGTKSGRAAISNRYGQTAEAVRRKTTEISGAQAEILRNRAVKNMQQALEPKNRETKKLAEQISPELVKRRAAGATAERFDSKLIADYKAAGENLIAAEASIPENYMVNTAEIVKNVDAGIRELSRPGRKGKAVTINKARVRALEDVRATIADLPDNAPFSDVLWAKRQYYDLIDQGGGFKLTSRERAINQGRRTGVRAINDVLADASPEMAAANGEFSFYSNVHDIIDFRRAGEIGVKDNIMRALGRVSDDVLVTSVGYYFGGVGGAVAAEGFNLMRTSRGVRSLRASFQSALADSLERYLTSTPKAFGLLTERAGGPYAMEGGTGRPIPSDPFNPNTSLVPFERGVNTQGVVSRGPGGQPLRMPSPVRALIPENARPRQSLLPSHGGRIVTPPPKMSLKELASMRSRR